MVVIAWALTLVLSVTTAFEAAGDLWQVVGHHPEGFLVVHTPGGGAALEALHRWARTTSSTTFWSAIAAAALAALLGPWIAMAWLHAMARRVSVMRALVLGWGQYVPALLISWWVLLGMVFVVSASLLLPAAAHLLLRDQPDDRLHDVLVLVACAPAVGAWLAARAARDLARSALLWEDSGVWQAVRQGLARLSPRLVAAHAGYSVLGALLALSVVAIALWPASGGGAVALAAGLGQLATLARTATRGRWLALAVHVGSQPNEPAKVTRSAEESLIPGFEFPAPRAAGSTPPTR
jgi:hypothetical protein